jgi:hypothetical protein
VQVTDALGAKDAAPGGQVAVDSVPVPENAVSFTITLVSVTLPELVTRNEYVTTSPTDAVDWEADFTMEIAGEGDAVTDALEGGDVTSPPVGGVPSAVAVFVTEPASMSAWVTA